MNYILVYGLFNTVPTATVVAYFLFFMVGNGLYMICLRNENKIYTVLYTLRIKRDKL